MNILDIILLKYPGIQGVSYWDTQYNGSPWTKPIEGLVWENREYSKPTQQDLDRWTIDYNAQLNFKENKIINQPIYEQLNNIDLMSIRALREDDTQRLTDLEDQAVTLRAQLLPVQ